MSETGTPIDRPTLWEDVRALASGRAPFTSVYLPTDHAAQDAAHRLEIEWRHVRDRLAEQGAPAPVLDQVEGLVLSGHFDQAAAIIVDADGNTVVRALPETTAPMAFHGPLPHLGPLVALAQANPRYVVALVDRRGADIVSVVDGGTIVTDESVDGETDLPITKVSAGGWSQPRYQQRAENTWEDNAAAVAEEVAAVAEEDEAVVVIAAGDDRALTLLADHLPARVGPLLRVADTGGRAIDGSADELSHQVERIVATEVAKSTTEALQRFVELRERRATVADGPGAVFMGLREALVDELLVHLDADDDRTAWLDIAAPTLVAMEATTLRDLGVEPVEAPLVDVVVWSALGTGATVRLVPGSGPNVPAEGLGAFLRGPVAAVTET